MSLWFGDASAGLSPVCVPATVCVTELALSKTPSPVRTHWLYLSRAGLALSLEFQEYQEIMFEMFSLQEKLLGMSERIREFDSRSIFL